MTFGQFISKYSIALPSNVNQLCHEGLAWMERSLDPTHELTHIERIFDNLDGLLTKEALIKRGAIDFAVLLLAICWHDVWKASRIPGGIKVIVFDEYWEGIGSAKLFRQAADEVSLPKEPKNRCAYAIFAHASLFVGHPKTQEAVILRDVDRLDYWNFDRVQRLEREYLEKRKINYRFVKLAKLYFDLVLNRATGPRFVSYPWTQKEYISRKEKFLNQLNDLIQKYGRAPS